MMVTKQREALLTKLDHTVADAAAFLSRADEHLTDGHFTARGLLAHLVYWHQRFIEIAESLRDGQQPMLEDALYDKIDANARYLFRGESMLMLAQRFSERQRELHQILLTLPDWSVSFPDKSGCQDCTVTERIEHIEGHIRGAVNSLKRAARVAR